MILATYLCRPLIIFLPLIHPYRGLITNKSRKDYGKSGTLSRAHLAKSSDICEKSTCRCIMLSNAKGTVKETRDQGARDEVVPSLASTVTNFITLVINSVFILGNVWTDFNSILELIKFLVKQERIKV